MVLGTYIFLVGSQSMNSATSKGMAILVENKTKQNNLVSIFDFPFLAYYLIGRTKPAS